MRRNGFTLIEIVVVIVLLVVVALLAWCAGGGRGSVSISTFPPSWVRTDTVEYHSVRTEVVTQMGPVIEQLAAEPWYIYEYHDEQKFPVGANYGPFVHVFVSPYLSGYTDITQFDTHGQYGILVGVIYVEGDPTGQAPYDALNLKQGVNCVHLAHDRAQPVLSGWTGYITPAATTGIPCPHTFSLASPLSVTATEMLSIPGPPGHFGDKFIAYPAAARIEEGLAEKQAIGVKCLSAWCVIKPAGYVPVKPVHTTVISGMTSVAAVSKATGANSITYNPAAPPGARMQVQGWLQGEVTGWYDQQRIAVVDAAGVPKPSNMWASLVPHPDLNNRDDTDYDAAPLHVATVWLAVDPIAGSDFDVRWHYKAGPNLIWAKRDAATGNWSGFVEQAGTGTQFPFTSIKQHKHYDVAIPAGARWKWKWDDEIIWFDCGAGACCEVDM
jgi:prepilin-type N-terminal cleavage/methylation domain-containing protein